MTDENKKDELPKTNNTFQKVCNFFSKFCCRKKNNVTEEKKIRENLSEKKIDKMVKDSFPASDPPSTY